MRIKFKDIKFIGILIITFYVCFLFYATFMSIEKLYHPTETFISIFSESESESEEASWKQKLPEKKYTEKYQYQEKFIIKKEHENVSVKTPANKIIFKTLFGIKAPRKPYPKTTWKDALLRKNVNDRTNKIFIWTTTRSGSSLLGHVFKKHKDVFYMFEPFQKLGWIENNTMRNNTGLLLLHNLLDCHITNENMKYYNSMRKSNTGNYDSLTNINCSKTNSTTPSFLSSREIFQMARTPTINDGVLPKPTKNRSLQKTIPLLNLSSSKRSPNNLILTGNASSLLNKNTVNRICFSVKIDIQLFHQECAKHKHIVVKEIHTRVFGGIKGFHLFNNNSSPVKFLHLIRDPRAFIYSQRNAKFHNMRNNTFIKSIKMQCDQHVEDYKYGSRLLKSQNLYKLVRYEDLCNDFVKRIKDLFRFVDLNIYRKFEIILEWLSSFKKIKAEQISTYSLNRNMKKQSSKWRSSIPVDLVNIVEEKCSEFMQLFKYKKVYGDRGFLRDMNRNLF